jgi:heptosyltransferase-2
MVQLLRGVQPSGELLFDPDKIFENNVRRAGVKNYLTAYAKISDENMRACN